MAARHAVAPVGDGTLRDLHPRGIAAQAGAVAPPGQRHPVTPGPRLEILEVEAEDVVPLEDVGISLRDEPGARPQQLGLVHLGARQHRAPARRIRQGDRDDPVALPRGIGELEARRRQHLDVQRQPPEVAEGHAAERGAGGAEEILVDGVREEEVGPLRVAGRAAGDAATVLARLHGQAPRGKCREPTIGARSGERAHLARAREALQEVPIGEENERPEGLLRGDDGAVAAGIGTHRDVAGNEGEESRRVVSAEQQRIARRRAAGSGSIEPAQVELAAE